MERAEKTSGARPLILVAAVGCGCMVALAAVAAVAFAVVGANAATRYQLNAKRSEVPSNVEAIKIAQLSYDAAYDGYVPAGSEAEARASLTPEPRAWKGGGGWETLAWAPYADVRGGYWVVTTSTGFEVHGVIDADGDGVAAEYVATESRGATLVTPPDVY